ncbi:MAG TPA: histidine kinase, partial [Longimicrobiales bacterium]|nr:histidine kinase [Longimicrobiales bacterium]
AMIISLAHLGFRVWFMHVIGHGYPHDHTFLPHFQEGIKYRWWVHLLTYFAILGIGLLGDYYRKYRDRQLLASQLSAQLSQARLHALRMQLNPHFLFNSLNNIAMLTRKNENATAVKMLAGLADLLRYVLEDDRGDEVSLREEIAFVNRYLEIERLRFADRLKIKSDVDEETLDAFVPTLILQPIVENAIQHGMAKANPGVIEIAARKLGDRLVLQVRDDGPGLANGPRASQGVGLSNSRRRLEQLYGDLYSLDIRNGDESGVVVTISLPFHTQRQVEAVSVA